ncbi:type I secretion system permease/ATPase [Pseudahrensia aquimaris]|uniref:Type I secretion system permease/ATPase n=1 Tax=Pseudahrensia aquimaris TaxID=744461 RepID=A0ABW3FC13_9HYPH
MTQDNAGEHTSPGTSENAPVDAIGKAVDELKANAASQKNSDEAPPNTYIRLTELLARHHKMPFARAAAERNLPAGYEQMHRHILPRILESVGLRSQFVLRKLAQIDEIVLPCIVFDKTGKALLLIKLDKAAKLATFVDLAEGAFTQEAKFRALQKRLEPEVLFVTADAEVTVSRMDEANVAPDKARKHWFWKPVRENKAAWMQILLAALGINIFGLALPIFVMNVYDRVIPNLALVTMWTLAIGVGIALFLDLVLKIIRTNVLELAGRRIDMKVASSLFQHAMNIRLLERRGGAAGIANQIREFEFVREFFTSSSFIAMVDMLFVGIFVFVLWVIVGPIALVPLLAVPLVIIIALIAQIPIGRSVEKAQALSSKRHMVLIESLMGIETIKSLNGEPVMQREWENAVAASTQISGRTRFWSNFAISSTALIQQLVSVFILLWGVYLVTAGKITVGGLIAANILAGRVLAPLGNICQTLIRAQQAFKSLSGLSDYMNLPVETGNDVRSELKVRDGAIEFHDVSFTYPDAKVAALSNVNLKLAPGESIGILGRVGSGKTTFGKMTVGLIQPSSGIILVDGYEMQQYEPSVLREGIGYLPQDPELFTGTIRENLMLGRVQATEEDINRALYFAGMDYFIAENPEGLNQFVGEKGNRLSGGQRQAIALARLLLRKPRALFLDEPTNAMDSATEAIVIKRLKELQDEGVAMIISTHRHSLANIVDRIIVLDNGKMIAHGPTKAILDKLSGKAPPKQEAKG